MTTLLRKRPRGSTGWGPEIGGGRPKRLLRYDQNRALGMTAKRKSGRPATGRDPMVSIRLPKWLIHAFDTEANEAGSTRSELIRSVLINAVDPGARRERRRRGVVELES